MNEACEYNTSGDRGTRHSFLKWKRSQGINLDYADIEKLGALRREIKRLERCYGKTEASGRMDYRRAKLDLEILQDKLQGRAK